MQHQLTQTDRNIPKLMKLPDANIDAESAWSLRASPSQRVP